MRCNSIILWLFILTSFHSWAQSLNNPCDQQQILQHIGGIENYKALQPESLGTIYAEYKECPNKDVRFKVELGIAYLYQFGWDANEADYLFEAAKKANDNYARAILEYQGVKLRRGNNLEKYDAYKRAVELISGSDHSNSPVAAKLNWNVAKYIVRHGFEGDHHSYFRKAIQLYKTNNNHYKVLDTYSIMIQDLVDKLGDTITTKQYLDEARVYCWDNSPINLPMVLNAGGWLYHKIDRKKSTEYFKNGLDICEDQIKNEYQCSYCHVISTTCIGIAIAQRDIAEAERIAELMPSFIGQDQYEYCTYYLAQATLKSATGEHNRALVFLEWADQCYGEYFQDPLHGNKLNVWDMQLMTFDKAGDIPAARLKAKEAIAYYNHSGMHMQAGKVYGNLAVTLNNNGHYQEAYEIFHSDTIEIPDGFIVRFNKAQNLTDLGMYKASNKYLAALSGIELSAEDRAQLLAGIATNYLHIGDLNTCKQYLDSAANALTSIDLNTQGEIPEISKSNLNEQKDLILLLRAELQYALFNRNGKSENLDSALALIESANDQLQYLMNMGWNTSDMANRWTSLEKLELNILRRSEDDEDSRSEQLFQLIERSRNRQLQRSLLLNEFSNHKSKLKYDSLKRSLDAKVRANQDRIITGDDFNLSTKEIVSEMAALENAKRSILIDLQTMPDTTIALGEIEEWAKQEAVQVLSYYIGDSALYLLHISPDGSKTYSKDLDINDLNSLIETCVTNISSPSGNYTLDLNERLSNWLLPNELALTSERLIIVPDGMINKVSFGSLLIDGTYLNDQFQISFNYSIGQGIVEDSSKNKGMLAIAPSFKTEAKEITSITGRSKWLFDRSAKVMEMCGPLPNNTKEAQLAAQLFDGMTLIGEDATEKEFTTALNDQSIVLLSTHGFNYNEDPMLSGLVFSNAFDTIAQDTMETFHPVFFQNDGILHAFEIYDMNINVDLVVLSACHSGTGQYKEGEGTMSLARAFMAAGAQSVVMSLWQVDDESTLEIISSFLQYLKEGMRKSEALAQAKRDYRKAHMNASPYYWAGLVLVGNDAPIGSTTGKNWIWALLAGTVVLIIAGRIYHRSRRATA